MARTPFFGAAYTSRSSNFADCRQINLYSEVSDDGGKLAQSKDIGVLYLAPGLTLRVTCGSGPVRALHTAVFPNNPTLYAVSGNHLYSIDKFLTVTDLGAIGPTAAGPAVIIDNGQAGKQVAVFSGNLGFSWSPTAGLQPITLPFNSRPISASYMDGFGVINQAGSALWFQSNLLDLTTWDALNFASADTTPDNAVALARVRRDMYVIKEFDTEIWDNVGTPGFVFARNPTLLIEHGCIAPASVAKTGEALVWLARNSEGLGTVVLVDGYAARRISTHGLEDEILTYPRIDDAIGYAYQQSGHHFYMLTFPSGDATWCYDRTTSEKLGVPVWHQRAWLDGLNGIWRRHWSNCYANFNGHCLVGDYSNGNIYEFDYSAFLDWQTPRAWLRSWRAIAQPTDIPTRYNSLRIDMQTGIDVAPSVYPATGPLLTLRCSDDGGHTWPVIVEASAGRIGETAARVKFNRLGATRRNSGLDRIFELTSGDIFPAALIGAELE